MFEVENLWDVFIKVLFVKVVKVSWVGKFYWFKVGKSQRPFQI